MRTRIFDRVTGAIIGALLLALVAVLAGVVHAGPLDPPGPVGSSMHTLDEMMPSWSRTMPSDTTCNSARFVCVLPDANFPDGAGVLDHETGLVWQRNPSVTEYDSPAQYLDALRTWWQLILGGRQGWRLPAPEELASLLDADSTGPFNVGEGGTNYFTSTVFQTDPVLVTFDGLGGIGASANSARAWCVRSGTPPARP